MGQESKRMKWAGWERSRDRGGYVAVQMALATDVDAISRPYINKQAEIGSGSLPTCIVFQFSTTHLLLWTRRVAK